MNEEKILIKKFKEKFNESLNDIPEELINNIMIKNNYSFYKTFADIMLDNFDTK